MVNPKSLTLVQQTKADIQKGSKSFSLASLFFSKDEKEAAWKLYSWCRYCDDVIDHAPSLAEAQDRVQNLIEKTQACYAGIPPEEHPWPAFCSVVNRYHIPLNYPLDMLRGFQTDATGIQINNEKDLFDYCYCVAGTVGLMMSHVMGVSSQKALTHAVDLGRAMQLTNIARDIYEDSKINRLYLPETWLSEVGLTRENYLDSNNSTALKTVLHRLIHEAQHFYRSGLIGLEHLSLRSAWAVCIALYVYRDIGEQVLKSHSITKRVIVSPLRKIYLLFKASFRLVPITVKRLFRPWKAAPQIELWREV